MTPFKDSGKESRELGRIKNIDIRRTDGRVIVHVDIGGDGWGVGEGRLWWWSESIQITPSTQWTEADRIKMRADCMLKIEQWMRDAKVDSFFALKDKPVEVTFIGTNLKEWRILTEVL